MRALNVSLEHFNYHQLLFPSHSPRFYLVSTMSRTPDSASLPYPPAKRARLTQVTPYSTPILTHDSLLVQDWTQCDDPEWLAFHREWWGKSFNMNADVLKVASEKIWCDLKLLARSQGLLFVRYETMYTRLVNACMKGVPPGVIITGHPGIGKSEFSASRIRRMTD